MLLEYFIKDSNIKTNEDLANYKPEKFIYLFQKAFATKYNENNEENLDSEDGIKDIAELIVIKMRNFIQDESIKEN